MLTKPTPGADYAAGYTYAAQTGLGQISTEILADADLPHDHFAHGYRDGIRRLRAEHARRCEAAMARSRTYRAPAWPADRSY